MLEESISPLMIFGMPFKGYCNSRHWRPSKDKGRGDTPSASSGESGMIKQIRSFQAVISSVEKMSNAGRVGRGSSTLRGLEEEKALESRPEWER